MTPKIDDSPINTRTDWMHLENPDEPQDEAMNYFPGVPQWILARGPLMPQPIDLTGFIQGTDPTDLNLAIIDLANNFYTLGAMRNNTTHKLTVYVEYEPVVLRTIKKTTKIQRASSPDGSILVVQGVLLRFLPLVFPAP
jgi:hypothetical protein